MQTVVITGASRGIGRALTEKFLESEYRVVGTSTLGDKVFSHENFQSFKLDLRSAESIKNFSQELANSGVRVDLLINNAGTLLDEHEKILKTDLLRQTLEVNLVGTADFTEQILPLMNKGGHIVMLSSSAGSIGRTGNVISRYPSQYPAYKVSKAALNMYMRTLAVRLREAGIAVSSVHPGWARTDMGGEEATISPAEAAETVFKIAIGKPESGHFWNSEGELPW